MTSNIYDERVCALGEGPLWHPQRKQLFWFDILNRKLMSRSKEGPRAWQFEEYVSAAGWIDYERLLIASARGLWKFDLSSGDRSLLCALEADDPDTRSNDGRADPCGGFWVGTMGCEGQTGAGAIYRFYKGEVRKLFAEITISNSICFAPDRTHAYFSDTATAKVMQVPIDTDGWPSAAPRPFVDFSDQGLNPDGAVVDADGNIWIALWGAARVVAYDASGQFLRSVSFAAHHVTCPAFGGDQLDQLFVTSARQGISDEILEASPEQGMTFTTKGVATGLAEPKVIL